MVVVIHRLKGEGQCLELKTGTLLGKGGVTIRGSLKKQEKNNKLVLKLQFFLEVL